MSAGHGMDLAAIGAFVAVGDTGGFRAAAAKLGMTSAGVSKAVARLEAQLGVTLVARTTRSVRLTSAGAAFHARSKAILADLAEAGAEAAEAAAVPRGRLTIGMSVSYGRARVLPVVAEYVNLHPQVEVEARLSDRIVDLVGDGVDLAVRLGHLPDSGLVASRVAETGFVLCGAPEYLDRAGVPRHPDELAGHEFVSYVTPGTANRFASRLTVDDGEALVEAATRSLGLVMVADYVAEPLIAEGRLVRLPGRFEMPPVPVSLVHLPTRNPSPAARAFTALLRRRLKGKRSR